MKSSWSPTVAGLFFIISLIIIVTVPANQSYAEDNKIIVDMQGAFHSSTLTDHFKAFNEFGLRAGYKVTKKSSLLFDFYKTKNHIDVTDINSDILRRWKINYYIGINAEFFFAEDVKTFAGFNLGFFNLTESFGRNSKHPIFRGDEERSQMAIGMYFGEEFPFGLRLFFGLRFKHSGLNNSDMFYTGIGKVF